MSAVLEQKIPQDSQFVFVEHAKGVVQLHVA